ncbi:hypothetical protein MNBD_GAMMA05-1270 [hydrothermal vent metagenome]|uniref:Glycosyltransferase 2-like domain-containing protein n=1 Tax=hydrothermal vent metagenome TaxID=652676 RepID=A0A3B0WEV6_9ZZZZ
MSDYKLTVVIAVQHSQENLPEIIRMLNPVGHENVEFIFCCTPADSETDSLVAGFDNVSVLSVENNSLIPVLWGDGIKVAQAEKVALSTAHCVPTKNWVDTLLAVDMTTLPAIGGIIENDSAASARDWAIFFLRYVSFAPPQQKKQIHEIAADNAVYRTADILQHKDLLEIGFWEPSFHARFRKAGLSLELDPEIKVVHKNHYSSAQFFAQRLAHGKEFGLERAGKISTFKRRLLILLSPLLPVIFLKKIISAVLQHGGYNAKLITAFPWLLLFLLAWGLGEAKGYLAFGRHVKNDK